MGPLTDEELMLRFCDGDQTAFDALYERHAGRVQGFLARMVREPALAEDLLQTTFLSLIRSRDRYDRGMPVAPWLLTIAGNAARDALRRRKFREDAAASPEVAEIETSVQPSVGDPGVRRRINAALQELPVQQREAVVLHKVEGLSFEQIAQSLGITATAARIRAHRGYEKLRTLLADLEVA